MSIHHRKLVRMVFTMNGINFECQLQTANIVNNTEDGEKQYSFCGPGEQGEFREEAEPDYALEMTYWADWRSNGLSDFLTANAGQVAEFLLDHHPDIPAEHVQRGGKLYLKDPGMGGEARTTEQQEVTLPIIGTPTYVRVNG